MSSDVMANLKRAAAAAKMESGRARILIGAIGELCPLAPSNDELTWAPHYGQRHPHECFTRAAHFIIDNFHSLPDETALVHGVLHRTGISHAWVLLPGHVLFDGFVQRYYDAGDYHRSLDAEAERTYPMKEAMARILKTRNFGPWHDSAGLGVPA